MNARRFEELVVGSERVRTYATGDSAPAVVVLHAWCSIGGPTLAKASVPVLGHFAENDPYEPEEGVRTFEQALRDAKRSVDIHRDPGTGHWFAEPSRDAWRPEAANLAFERTARFLMRQLEA